MQKPISTNTRMSTKSINQIVHVPKIYHSQIKINSLSAYFANWGASMKINQ